MNNDDRLKDIMENPQTKGEQEQSNSLGKFSKDYRHIVDIRKKLKKLTTDMSSDDKKLEFQKKLYKKQKDVPTQNKRKYDKSLISEKPPRGLKHLFSYFRIKSLFKNKYKKSKKISWSLRNLLNNGSVFFPSGSVYQFVQNLVMQQELLREAFRKMYTSGWLTEEGEDVLSPGEFNLIGEMERLASDETILNFLINHKRPQNAIKKISPFLGHYLSITRSKKTKTDLINAAEKSMKRIVYTDPKELKTIEKVITALNQFLSGEIENNFIIPLFESAFLSAFSDEKLRSYIALHEIEEGKYLADPNLLQLMAARKKSYLEKMTGELDRIEEEIAFISDIQNSLEINKEILPDVTGTILEYLLFHYYHKSMNILDAKKNNLTELAGVLCDIFAQSYESFLLEGATLKIDNEFRVAKIFDSAIFIKEVQAIKSKRRSIRDFENKAYPISLLQEKTPDKEKLIFLNTLTGVNDSFYSIGKKLSTALLGHTRALSDDAVDAGFSISEKGIGHSTIPSYDQAARSMHSSQIYKYTIANKKIIDIISEIKDFSLCFSYSFEFTGRDFSKSIKLEPYADKLLKLKVLQEKLSQFDTGDDEDDDDIFADDTPGI
ncbi:MAG: hypothetical protein GY754_19910 [bacterium]|nr:hypothetical protein [bacterium]